MRSMERASTAQETASYCGSGAINGGPKPATSLPAKLPLGRQSTVRCAPTKPFGRGKAVTMKTITDAQVTHLASAILDEAARTAAVKSRRSRVKAVVRS